MNTKKESHKYQVIDSIIIVVMIFLILILMLNVSKIQGTARVINYAGILRGATQQLIKLEVTGRQNEELQEYLDDIIDGLLHGSAELNLIKLEDDKYQQKLLIQMDYWQDLKQEIQYVRESGVEDNTHMIDMSEFYFDLADQTVSAAEEYAQKLASTLRIIEIILSQFIIVTVIYLIYGTFRLITLSRINHSLKQKAYLDQHTGLPNKSKCEELLKEDQAVKVFTGCIMFDMNGLKKVNDTLGHVAGDNLIVNFATIIRNAIPEKYFVGRYGGDEFIALLDDVTDEEAAAIENAVACAVQSYNEYLSGNGIPLSFASGYATLDTNPGVSLCELLEIADQKMYRNKKLMKEDL